MRLSHIVTLAAFALAVSAAPAPAAETLGSNLAGEPTQACTATYDCTLAQLAPGGGTATVASAAGGYITSFAVKHGAMPAGVDIPAVGLRVLTPTGGGSYTARVATGPFTISTAAATERFAVDPVQISAGELVALYSTVPTIPFLAAGTGAGEVSGNHATGTAASYDAREGQLLLQVTVSSSPSGDTGTGADEPVRGNPALGIPPYVAGSITAFQAQTIDVYRAPTIKLLPKRTNLHDAILRGFSTPINCSLACRITASATLRGISSSLLGMSVYSMDRAGPRPRVIAAGASRGSFPTAGRGNLRLTLNANAKRLLRRHARSQVRLTVTWTVVDGTKTTRRTQVVTLVKPRRS